MSDLCHNGHPFAPGVDIDMETEGRFPDSRWCNICGETRDDADKILRASIADAITYHPGNRVGTPDSRHGISLILAAAIMPIVQTEVQRRELSLVGDLESCRVLVRNLVALADQKSAMENRIRALADDLEADAEQVAGMLARQWKYGRIPNVAMVEAYNADAVAKRHAARRIRALLPVVELLPSVTESEGTETK